MGGAKEEGLPACTESDFSLLLYSTMLNHMHVHVCAQSSLQKGSVIFHNTLLGCSYYYYYYRESIKSKENQAIIVRLVKEVKGLNPTFSGANIRGKFICN